MSYTKTAKIHMKRNISNRFNLISKSWYISSFGQKFIILKQTVIFKKIIIPLFQNSCNLFTPAYSRFWPSRKNIRIS